MLGRNRGAGHDAAAHHLAPWPAAGHRRVRAVHPPADPRHARFAADGDPEPPRRGQREADRRHRHDGGVRRRSSRRARDRRGGRSLRASSSGCSRGTSVRARAATIGCFDCKGRARSCSRRRSRSSTSRSPAASRRHRISAAAIAPSTVTSPATSAALRLRARARLARVERMTCRASRASPRAAAFAVQCAMRSKARFAASCCAIARCAARRMGTSARTRRAEARAAARRVARPALVCVVTGRAARILCRMRRAAGTRCADRPCDRPDPRGQRRRLLRDRREDPAAAGLTRARAAKQRPPTRHDRRTVPSRGGARRDDRQSLSA